MICSRCSSKFPDEKSICPKCGKVNMYPEKQAGKLYKRLSDASDAIQDRLQSGGWDVCFGPANKREKNGIVKTSCTLIGGLAGAGKSTLSLQLSDAISTETRKNTLYICSEEETDEVKLRAKRLDIKRSDLICCASTLTSSEAISSLERVVKELEPCAIILDSLQGLTGEDMRAGVEVCKILKRLSVQYHAPSIIIDHVNKQQDLAGLYTLQHAVDTVMTLFPNNEDGEIRELENIKNRFGRAFVIAFLQMSETGLEYIGCSLDDEGEKKDEN